jgi:hypothetical protein
MGAVVESILFDERRATEVLEWRYSQLARSGYSPDAAMTLATHWEVDLHQAADLVERGCPTGLALRILL